MTKKKQTQELHLITFGRDRRTGEWWWRNDADPQSIPRGPFATHAEATENFRVTVLGPQCEIVDGGVISDKVH